MSPHCCSWLQEPVLEHTAHISALLTAALETIKHLFVYAQILLPACGVAVDSRSRDSRAGEVLKCWGLCVSTLLPSEVSRADHWLPILCCGCSSQPVSDSSPCQMYPAAAVSMADHKQTPHSSRPLSAALWGKIHIPCLQIHCHKFSFAC